MLTPTVNISPFGSSTGRYRDLHLTNLPSPMQLNSLEIWSRSGSTDGVIKAMRFSYLDDHRQLVEVGPWGNTSSVTPTQYKKIEFLQGVYLKEISGFTNDSYVTSLTVVTSDGAYPFGKVNPAGEKPFSVPVVKGSIVAFFGRSDDYLNAIGAYISAA